MKTQPIFYFERESGVVHCEAANGQDYTLCGFSLDGDQGEIAQVVGPGIKISCPTCLGIVAFCHTIPKRALSILNSE